MTKFEGFTISTFDKVKGIAIDTHFTGAEALMLTGLVIAGTTAVIYGVGRLGIAYVEKIKEKF